jgi:6-phosphogluconolactonase (cycloisomerase 2 family)
MKVASLHRFSRVLAALVLAGTLAGGLAAPVAAQSDEPIVFIVNNVSDEITTFTMNDDGTMNFIGTYPTSDGPMVAAVTPDGKYLAVTHGTGNSQVEALQIFQVNSDASLTMVLDTLVPDSPMAAVWLNDDILAVTETDVGGDNYAHTYFFDRDTPSLTLVDSADTGSFNTSLVRHPALDVLYAQDSWTYYAVHWLTYEDDGGFTSSNTIGTGSHFPLKLCVTQAGDFLYAACGISGDGHRVLGFRVDAVGGLTALDGSPFHSPGQSPAHVTPSRDGAFLFVGHGTDATVRSFTIDAEGALAATGYMFDVGMQGSIGDVKVFGDYLLVTDETTAGDGVAGLYSFLIHENGSFTLVADIYDTDGVRPEAIATWAPGCPADFDGDGDVDTADLLHLLGAWGTPDGDVDGDGDTDTADLLALLGAWGPCA